MRSKGYSAAIMTVCAELDAQLHTIYYDLTLYLGTGDGDADDTTAATAAAADDDHAAVVRYLQATSRDGVAQLISAIKSTGTAHRSPSACVALATLLAAIVELCPHLKRCLFQDHTANRWPEAGAGSNVWDSVVGLLTDESLRCWDEWIEQFAGALDGELPATAVDYRQLAGDMLQWERITVEERDELEQPVQSAIRVPAHCSVGAQRYWHRVCVELLAVAPYQLPRAVNARLTGALTRRLHGVYARRAAHGFVQASQTASLQCYFDVRFVQLLFVGREVAEAAKAKQVDDWSALAAQFKANVDPFDFELFHKYVMANVKRAVQRMQVRRETHV